MHTSPEEANREASPRWRFLKSAAATGLAAVGASAADRATGQTPAPREARRRSQSAQGGDADLARIGSDLSVGCSACQRPAPDR